MEPRLILNQNTALVFAKSWARKRLELFRFCCDSSAINVATDQPDHVRYAANYCKGFFKTIPFRSGQVNLYLIGNPELCTAISRASSAGDCTKSDIDCTSTRDGIFAQYSDPDAPDCTASMLFAPDYKVAVAGYNPHHSHGSLVPLRLIRAWLVTELWQSGWSFLHAAAAGVHGAGIGIVGEKMSGKTTTLINLLAMTRARPVANDQVVWRWTNEFLEARGLPIRASIRKGTIEACKKLKQKLRQVQDRVDHGWDGRSRVTMQELARWFETQIQPTCKLEMFLIPRFDQGVPSSTLVRASESDVYNILREQHLSQPQDILPYQPFCVQLISHENYVERTGMNIDAGLHAIAHHIPFYWLIQNGRDNVVIYQEIVRLLDKIRAADAI